MLIQSQHFLWFLVAHSVCVCARTWRWCVCTGYNWTPTVTSLEPPNYFLRQVLLVAWNSPPRLDDQWAQGSCCLCLPRAVCITMPILLCGIWDSDSGPRAWESNTEPPPLPLACVFDLGCWPSLKTLAVILGNHLHAGDPEWPRMPHRLTLVLITWSGAPANFTMCISLWGAADPLKKAKATKQQLCKSDGRKAVASCWR